MDPLRLNQAPVLQDWRRNVATTVLVLTLGTVIVAGGADWSYRGLQNWAHSKVNTNITLPMTHWQLEVRMRWVQALPPPPVTIHDYFQQHPIKTKLYSVTLLCSPRWALLWAWLFDKDAGLELLHAHIAEHQAISMDYLRGVVAALVPDVLPEVVVADNAPLVRLGSWVASLHSSTLFWLGWLLCPGMQAAWYTFFFATRSPIKFAYATLIGLARTAVELSALFKCLQALGRGNKSAVVNSLVCWFLLPLIMTLQSIAVLLLFCITLPSWITSIAMVAFCLWGPPVMIALMTAAFQPERQQHVILADPPAGFNMPAAHERAGAAAAAGGAVAAAGEMVAAAGGDVWQHDQNDNNQQHGNRRLWGRRAESLVHWPTPLKVPEHVEDAGEVPHYFICPITHCIMSEPAVTITGATYERAAILEWLKSQKRDPLTSRELRADQISPNLALFRAIDEWLEPHRVTAARQQQQQQQQAQQEEVQGSHASSIQQPQARQVCGVQD